ncbi:MAG: FliH/SctL family protein [Planctomycetota bacterium]
MTRTSTQMSIPTGTSMSSVPVTARLVGLRLHARRGPGGVPEAPAARALLDLKARNEQRLADEKALRQLVATARAQVAALPGQVRERTDEVAALAVELGLQIARELVGAALDKGLVDPTPTVARCLADCVHGSDRSDLVVKLNPADAEAVRNGLAQLPELAEEAEAARFVADASVPRGGVRAETGAGRLRYDPLDVLQRICDEVRREASS